ncbi:ATP dependent DNA helicase [Trichosporon asahii var. asahii CBS 2479]|uniref:DNA 3'-5' helicase n=1 Tax=Trichosporon asahii var. asahii (strain ATCC 90039 / CBS 2479 / JCM 2466 / KCTC 7840 / NBRC 103889/ NCYC 2677 / UAMH 7654) TaxID=1186058 RepID=J5TMM1_TRIAS|nr:ATP dependent DNA helicase [Trichosporon asahii var. asahii CBS 2479]EJT51651.1 ATP dependent DNA helicase [Trichosporon asahii var. asahii CBS 2479]
MTDSNFSLAPLPTSTPQTSVYPCESGTQHARNNFVPRTFTRVPSGVERGASLLHILKKYWGYSKFRHPQQEVCDMSLKGCDVLVVAPTGIGKSICFQLPALTIEYGITIVVSPLKALMAEQVMSLREKGIPVAALNENTSRAEHVFHELKLAHPRLRLLYATPESLCRKDYQACFNTAHQQKQIARIVIDEAHVLYEWGNTFRPSVEAFVRQFPDIPKTAVTASATAEIRSEIARSLRMKRDGGNLAQFVLPVNRKNLFYECDVVAEKLNDSGITASPFYARMPEAQKSRALVDWKDGKISCIVATIAFGMGIDHPHVRYVVHADMPKSFEGYYQETGRCGRDGHRSRSREDAARAMSQANSTGMERANRQMLNSLKTQFAEDTSTCRHIGVCRYFGEIIETDPDTVKAYCDGMCDVCANRAGVYLAAQHLTEDCAPLSPIEPLEPLEHSSPPRTTRQDNPDCTLAALHDEPQTGLQWTGVFSTFGTTGSGIGSTGVSSKVDDDLAPLFDNPDSDGDSEDQRAHQTPLFDVPGSLPASEQSEPPPIVDLTGSSSPHGQVGTRGGAPPSTIASAGKGTLPPPRTAPRRAAPSILQALDVNGTRPPQPRAESSRQWSTIDEIADQGISGAVVISAPRSPGHAKRKQREREKTFKDVAPLSGDDAAFSFYNSAPPRKKSRVERLKFKTPGPALSAAVPQSSPLTRISTGDHNMLHGTPPPAASPARPVTDRRSGLARLLTALTVSLEKGDLADEILAFWKRNEVGEQR